MQAVECDVGNGIYLSQFHTIGGTEEDIGHVGVDCGRICYISDFLRFLHIRCVSVVDDDRLDIETTHVGRDGDVHRVNDIGLYLPYQCAETVGARAYAVCRSVDVFHVVISFKSAVSGGTVGRLGYDCDLLAGSKFGKAESHFLAGHTDCRGVEQIVAVVLQSAGREVDASQLFDYHPVCHEFSRHLGIVFPSGCFACVGVSSVAYPVRVGVQVGFCLGAVSF